MHCPRIALAHRGCCVLFVVSYYMIGIDNKTRHMSEDYCIMPDSKYLMLFNCKLPGFYFWTRSRSSLYFANEILLRSFPHCISLMRFCYARRMISQCTVIKVAKDWVLCYDQSALSVPCCHSSVAVHLNTTEHDHGISLTPLHCMSSPFQKHMACATQHANNKCLIQTAQTLQ